MNTRILDRQSIQVKCANKTTSGQAKQANNTTSEKSLPSDINLDLDLQAQ